MCESFVTGKCLISNRFMDVYIMTVSFTGGEKHLPFVSL